MPWARIVFNKETQQLELDKFSTTEHDPNLVPYVERLRELRKEAREDKTKRFRVVVFHHKDKPETHAKGLRQIWPDLRAGNYVYWSVQRRRRRARQPNPSP